MKDKKNIYTPPKKEYINMTIHERLNISNLLMVVIPIGISIVGIILCMLGTWAWSRTNTRLTTMDNDEVVKHCTDLVSSITEFISKSDVLADLNDDGADTDAAMSEAFDENEEERELQEDLDHIIDYIDESGIRICVTKDGYEYFARGKSAQRDRTLLKAAESIGTNTYITGGNRQLFVEQETIDSSEYVFYIYLDKKAAPFLGIRIYVVISILIIITLIIVSAVVTNHFLIHFVFGKIEGPLDILSEGVKELRDGNLSHRIDYQVNDEFRPVCESFNEMAQQLESTNQKLLDQEENRKELLASISHDLRSPLTSINAYTDGLIEGVAATPEARRRYLGNIKTKVEDMIRLVSELFLFSKMELGEYPVYPEIICLDKEVRDMVAAVGEDYADKGLKLSVLETCESQVFADPQQLSIIMTNIIENSLKYKKNDIGNLFFSVRKTENSFFVLTMRDDGPGVEEEALSKIFEVFYRSDPARKNPGSGSGLGLSIVSNAVKRMGGYAEALNAEGGGLEIRVFIPEYGEKRNETIVSI